MDTNDTNGHEWNEYNAGFVTPQEKATTKKSAPESQWLSEARSR